MSEAMPMLIEFVAGSTPHVDRTTSRAAASALELMIEVDRHVLQSLFDGDAPAARFEVTEHRCQSLTQAFRSHRDATLRAGKREGPRSNAALWPGRSA